jgi:DNA replication licensing factor MCM3
MAVDAASDERIQLKRRFADFLERPFPSSEDPDWNYGKGLSDLYTAGDEGKAVKLVSRRLTVSEHHLREFDEPLLQRLLQHPTECLPAFEDALGDFIKSGVDPTLSKLLTEDDEIHVGLRGDFGRHEVSPRELNSSLLGKLVCLFGIVTKCSLVRPKVEKCSAFVQRSYDHGGCILDPEHSCLMHAAGQDRALL